MMQTYRDTRAHERAFQATTRQLRKELRAGGIRGKRQMHDAADRGSYAPLGNDLLRQSLTASQDLIPALGKVLG